MGVLASPRLSVLRLHRDAPETVPPLGSCHVARRGRLDLSTNPHRSTTRLSPRLTRARRHRQATRRDPRASATYAAARGASRASLRTVPAARLRRHWRNEFLTGTPAPT